MVRLEQDDRVSGACDGRDQSVELGLNLALSAPCARFSEDIPLLIEYFIDRYARKAVCLDRLLNPRSGP